MSNEQRDYLKDNADSFDLKRTSVEEIKKDIFRETLLCWRKSPEDGDRETFWVFAHRFVIDKGLSRRHGRWFNKVIRSELVATWKNFFLPLLLWWTRSISWNGLKYLCIFMNHDAIFRSQVEVTTCRAGNGMNGFGYCFNGDCIRLSQKINFESQSIHKFWGFQGTFLLITFQNYQGS